MLDNEEDNREPYPYLAVNKRVKRGSSSLLL